MAFPVNPDIGTRYTNTKGITYEFTNKGAWIVVATNNGLVKYTISDVAPETPSLGDQWWDTTTDLLKSWAADSNNYFWTVIGGTNQNAPIVSPNEPQNPTPGLQWYWDGELYVWIVIDGVGQWVPISNSATFNRALRYSWYYAEEKFEFELFNSEFSWRSYNSTKVIQVENGDDTVRVESTNGIIPDHDYLIVQNGNTLATISVLSVLSSTTFRTKTTLGFNLNETSGATITKTSFNLATRNRAVVTNGDILISKPLVALKDRSGFVYIRRTSTGTGDFRVDYRIKGEVDWVNAPFLNSENVDNDDTVRDDKFQINQTGIIEFKVTYINTNVSGNETVHFLALVTSKQNFENQRIFKPTNVTPADNASGISATPTLTLSDYINLYGIVQDGAEFQVALDRNFSNLVFSSSSNFLSGWVAVAGESAVFNAAILYNKKIGIAVGNSGAIRKTTDGGKTFTAGSTALATHIYDVAHNGNGRLLFAGQTATCQYSDNDGTTLSAITVPGGYTGDLNGVAAVGNNILFVGNTGKILRSTNGGTILTAMVPANSYAGNFKAVAMLANGIAVIVGASGEIQTSSNFGADWVKRNPPGAYSGTYNRVVIDNDGNVIAVGTNGAIHKSEDFGATWVAKTAANSFTGTFTGLAMAGKYVVATGANGTVQTSENFGNTFVNRVLAGSVSASINAVAINLEELIAFVAGASGTVQTALRLEGVMNSFTVPAGADLLQVNNVYWWRGRYKDLVEIWSEWSDATAFSTSGSFDYINQPSNTSPANNAANISVTPTLQSSAFTFVGANDTHATSRWQISTSPEFTTLAYDSGFIADKTSRTVPVGNALSSGVKYYWRVRYKGTSGRESPWSTATSFNAINVPNTPSITSPAASSTVSTSFTIQTAPYSSSSGAHVATQYQISANNFVSIAYDSGDSANLVSHTVPAGFLNYSTAYGIRVRHKDSLGQYSSWSPIVQVSTISVPNVGNLFRGIKVAMGGSYGTGTLNFGIDYTQGGMVLSVLDTWQFSGANPVRDSLRDTLQSNKLSTNVSEGAVVGGFLFTPTVTGLNWQGDPTAEYLYNPASATVSHSMFRKGARFFDVITYTGNGASNRQLTHLVNVKPGLVIVKSLNTSANWIIGTSADWNRNATFGAAQITAWLNRGVSEPTATHVVVSGEANTNGVNYICYIFANDSETSSIIRTGTYTGNANNMQDVFVGFKSQAVLVKRLTGADAPWWWAPTTQLVPYGGSWEVTSLLKYNLTTLAHQDATGASEIHLYQNNNGFTVGKASSETSHADKSLNATDSQYFYMAIKAP